MTKPRLRVVPAIAHEPEEGARLRRHNGARELPSRPWSSDIRELQIKADIAVTLLEAVFADMLSVAELHDVPVRDEVRIDELAHMIRAVQASAAALQPA